jgi:hypothetical protein
VLLIGTGTKLVARAGLGWFNVSCSSTAACGLSDPSRCEGVIVVVVALGMVRGEVVLAGLVLIDDPSSQAFVVDVWIRSDIRAVARQPSRRPTTISGTSALASDVP